MKEVKLMSYGLQKNNGRGQSLLDKTLFILNQNGEIFSDLFSPDKSKPGRQLFLSYSEQEQKTLQQIAEMAEALIGAA